MQKRAQLSVFIVVGLIILAAIGFLVYIKQPKAEEVPASMAHVKIFVDQCVKKVGEDALVNLGLGGGYLYFDNVEALPAYYGDTAYWYIAGYNFAPKDEIVKGQIDRYMKENLNSCLNNFDDLHENITFGEVESSADILPDKVIFNIDFPVTLNDRDIQKTISSFSGDVNIRLGRILSAGRKVIAKEMEDPLSIDLTYLSQLDLPVTAFHYDDRILIYMIRDFDYSAENPYRFLFASRLGKDKELGNRPPYFTNLEFILAAVGEDVSARIEAVDPEGDKIIYNAITPLFLIGNDGSIRFTPMEDDVGVYDVVVEAEDSKGAVTAETLHVEIYPEGTALE
ncbi:hypothetical protein COV19_07280 [Candidatus Woesearchaeota archaeon CG10_big_fil_rev_8_21_14_0_10_44_13]|nr:MAG: hypothetical protein COV19_07280 [Candidatus Woesearchaeota archaeon CG10_big_fil_rev_8_21_14_0_10_44_13]